MRVTRETRSYTQLYPQTEQFDFSYQQLCPTGNVRQARSTHLVILCTFSQQQNYFFKLLFFYILRYLTGNPCAAFKFYRLYVIGILPQLECLDGVPVLYTERLAAKADFDYIESEILEQESISNKWKSWTWLCMLKAVVTFFQKLTTRQLSEPLKSAVSYEVREMVRLQQFLHLRNRRKTDSFPKTVVF